MCPTTQDHLPWVKIPQVPVKWSLKLFFTVYTAFHGPHTKGVYGGRVGGGPGHRVQRVEGSKNSVFPLKIPRML